MRLSILQKQKSIRLKRARFSVSKIAHRLEIEDGISISCRGLRKFFKMHRETGLLRRPYKQARRKASHHHLNAIDTAIKENPGLTARDLVNMLSDQGLLLSESHMSRIRRDLGWIAKGTKYCHLIR